MNARINAKIWMLLIAGSMLFAGLGCQLATRALGDEPPPTLPPVATLPREQQDPTEPPAQPAQETAPAPAPTLEAAEPTQAEQPQSQAPAPSSEITFSGLETCEQEICNLNGYFPFLRPVGDAGRKEIDHANRYAAYRRSTGDSYHGVFFLNSTGTPVVAAADGVVEVAGDDLQHQYGSFANMYGNLVIIRHDLDAVSAPVYTLYAHLSEVSVGVDDNVQAGDRIGAVGSSGSVTGSTLYFEVRLGENEYTQVRNPELWLQPIAGEDGQLMGALAGRVLDAGGDYVRIDNIVLEQLGGPGEPAIDQLYLKTYAESRLVGAPPWEENFAFGDLPAGRYQVSFWLNGMQQQEVEIQPGGLTLVTFTLP